MSDPPPSAAGPDGSEAELLRRLRARDEAAFAQVIDRHHGSLLRFALGFVRSRAVAEEVVQETWLAVLDGLGSFEGRSSFKTWLFRILANRAKTRGAREQRSVPFSAFADPAEPDAPAVDPSRFRPDGGWAAPPERWDADTPERRLQTREALRCLEEALESLAPAQRTVLTLRDIEGLDSAEVCNILEITETNQRVLLHRARSRLRAALEAHLAAGGSPC
ncbi:MAG: sigma-70 family RNA polymerase sigma factor [Polyangiaceae bacterium]|nr:sigma-70 family RNA polymerase sigma factor [Polyangiaceae bacterium]